MDKFNNSVRTYIEGLQKTIKVYDTHLEINGTQCPLGLTTYHGKYELGSENHFGIMIEIFSLLKIFHDYCEERSLLYTLMWGNLIGWYRENNHLLWDDDIDILICSKGAAMFSNIWEFSEEATVMNEEWEFKRVTLGQCDVVLLKSRFKQNFFKLKGYLSQTEMSLGAIDITFLIDNRDGWNIDLSILQNVPETEQNYPLITYGPVTTRALRKQVGAKILSAYYGKDWVERIHPDCKKQKK